MKEPVGNLSGLSHHQRALLERRLLQRRNDSASTGVGRRTDTRAYPLAFGQQRLWFLEQLEPGTSANHIAGAVRLVGPLDRDALTRTFAEITNRHEVLRALFTSLDGEPAQQIAAAGPFDLTVTDVSLLSEAEREAELRRLAANEAARPFDLSSGPLFRARLFSTSPAEHVLVLTMHHIVADGWSTGILLREMAALYDAFHHGRPSPLPPLSIQYADFAAWQQNRLQGDFLERQVAWWREVLADAPVLELPVDRVRPAIQSTRGARRTRSLPRALTSAVEGLCRQERVTPFMCLLAAFNILLSRYTRTLDLVVGSPVAGRSGRETEGLIGLFVNTLLLRTDLSNAGSLRTLLRQTQRTVVDALSHQDVPFEMLVDELQPGRTLSHSPLAPVLFAFQNVPTGGAALADLKIEPFGFDRTTARFDLCLFVTDNGGEYTLSAEYSTDLFEAETIDQMLHAYETLIAGAVANPDDSIAALPMMTADERRQVVEGWQGDRSEYPRDRAVHRVFEECAGRTPDSVALEAGEEHITYRDLNARANRLARQLLLEGVGIEATVAVCLERSVEAVVAMLAVLKAGGAYVPLDPNLPDGRLGLMLADCGAPVAITTSSLAARIGGFGVRVVESDVKVNGEAADLDIDVSPDHRAYVMYTSGSTGVPKGVEVTHRGITRLLFGVDYVTLGPNETILQLAPLSFDAATFEVWGALLHGGRLVLYPDAVATPRELSDIIQRRHVTTMWLTGSLYNVLIDEDSNVLAPLRQLLIGGDALSLPHVRRGLAALPGTTLVNGYGPTESTTFTCCGPIDRDLGPDVRSVSIGRPIGNTQVYLVDGTMAPVPPGVPGELLIGGDGLARGYLRAPAATAEKWIPNPFGTGSRLYRSGDMARFLPDGRIEFLGRSDQQVKIRGYRIECGEIERAIVGVAGVREAVVVPFEQEGRKRLVAYIVTDPAQFGGIADARRCLLDALPDYMIPSSWLVLPSLPLNRNGKVERSALPDPGTIAIDTDTEAPDAAPRNDRERLLCDIWQRVLRVERVGVHDNFFELGGDSILGIQIVARASEAGLALTPKSLFQYQTIAELAEVAEAVTVIAAEQGLVTGSVPLTPIQHWFFELNAPNVNHFNQAVMLDVEADVEQRHVRDAVKALLDHHDALRMRLVRGAHGWDASIAGSTEAADVPFRVVAIEAGAAALETAAAAIQRSLALEQRVVCAALFTVPGAERARLLLVAHHLVVDGVSWRVLLGDLQTAYRQLTLGQSVRLPEKTTSWKAWAERLQSCASDADSQIELESWGAAIGGGFPLDQSVEPSDNTVAAQARLSVALTSEETQALLAELPKAFHTQINDVLLAALSLAVSRTAGPASFVVDLEGHGRESIFDDVDVSRTVGWFTSIFPVSLDAADPSNPLDVLKATKERLRAIPRKGIGYGILRYLSSDGTGRALAGVPGPIVSFNYLGQFDQVLEEGQGWRLAAGGLGPVADPSTPRAHLLDISAVVARDRLHVDWTYCESAYGRNTIEGLAAAFVSALRDLIAECAKPGAGGWTPSDFPLAKLDQRSLDRIYAQHPSLADVYPLSPLQYGMLFQALAAPESGAYVEQVSCLIDGPLDVPAFSGAWARVIERHAALRTAFEWREIDTPVQVVLRRAAPSWTIEDWRQVPLETREADVEAWFAADAARGFTLSDAPLLRYALLRTGEDTWRFIWSFHHILVDGWCLPILLKDVAAAYAATVGGRQLDWKRVTPYREHIAWLKRQDQQQAQRFWSETLEGFSVPTPLPVDRSNAADAEHRVRLSEALTRSVLSLARREQVTVNTVVQAAWALLLAKCAGESDVIFGTTVSGRPAGLRGVETMVGLFINTLPVRARIDWAEPVGAWLRRVQAAQIASREHEHLPLFEIQRTSEVPAGQPLFETLVVFENYPVDWSGAPAAAGSLRMREFRFRERTNFPLTLVVSPGPPLTLRLLSDGVSGDAATRLLRAFEQLLVGLAAEIGQPLREVRLLSAEDERQVLALGRGPEKTYPQENTIGALFDAQAATRPRAEAVRCGSDAFTYQELKDRSSRWANFLTRHGVGSDAVVGVCLEGGVELIAVLLGIVKAGGAYLALDPAYPSARLRSMLDETRASIVITESSLRDRLPVLAGATVVNVDGAEVDLSQESTTSPDPGVTAEHLAYVSYTSGSTGRPKGVAVPHRGVVRLLFGNRYVKFGPTLTWLQLAPVGFDASTLEIWGSLLHGGRLVVAADRMPTPQTLGSILKDEQVTSMWLTASFYNTVVDTEAEALRGLRHLLIGGEALSATHVRRGLAMLPGTQIINGYGPTESTTFTCCFPIDESAAAGRSIPIGPAIGHTFVYVLDPTGSPTPIGVSGELHIGGDGLARGYFGQPARTAERFVPDVFDGRPGARMYRTGDIVRMTSDGVVEFVGRADSQVKIRGFRIEPGEIESILATAPGVQAAAVVAREDTPGVKRLVAYVVPSEAESFDEEAARGFLRSRLPEYMVPPAFVALAQLPRNANGKLDRAALPAPELTRAADARSPRTPVETLLATIWAEVLGITEIGMDESFFELGGDSILSIQICARAQRAGWDISPRQLFEHPTVGELAAVAKRQVGRAGDAELGGVVSLLPAQHWFFEQERVDAHHFNQAMLLEMRQPITADIAEDALQALVRHHDALRARFTRVGDRWMQTIVPSQRPLPFALGRVELTGEDAEAPASAIERAAAALQASLDLAQAPMIRATWFDGPQVPRLLIVVHHLAVDAVSWRILLDDLDVACRMRLAGDEVAFPPKTSSVRQWCERLITHADSPNLFAARRWWRIAASTPAAPLPIDYAGGPSLNTVGASARITVRLESEETRALLREVPKAYQTHIDEVLLTALVQALAPWTLSPSVVVNLEGHGREPLFDELDLSRTVGWFTAMAPIRLTLASQQDPGAALRSVKEQLRSVPDGAFGYGVLRYLSQDASLRSALASAQPPDISFNYLGQYDGMAGTGTDRLITVASESAGATSSPRQRRPHLIDIVAMTHRGQLQLDWIYCAHLHSRATIEALAHRCTSALRALIAHCTSPGVGGYTPSDFPMAELEENQLNEVLSQVEFE